MSVNSSQPVPDQVQQAHQPQQQPQRAQQRVDTGIIYATGAAIAYVATRGAAILGGSLKALSNRSPEEVVKAYVRETPNIELHVLQERTRDIEPKSYVSIKFFFELITEFINRKQLEHVTYLINKLPRDFSFLLEPKNPLEYRKRIQQIENLAKSSLEAFIPYHDDMSVAEEIRYINQFAKINCHFDTCGKYITKSLLAVKSIKFHIMNQNLDRARELYKEFIYHIWEHADDQWSKEIAIFFLNALFKYDEQITNVINNQLGNVLCKDVLKITCDYLAKPPALAHPLAPILIAVETILDRNDHNFFWQIGAEWSLSLSPPQIEWASFAKSKIEAKPSTGPIIRQLDEKIARARAKMPAAIAMRDQ